MDGFPFLFFFFFYIAARSSLSQLRRNKGGMTYNFQVSVHWFWKPWNLLGKAEERFPETREKCFASESKQE